MAPRDDSPPYPEVPARPDFPALEQRTIAAWEAEGTFAASVAARAGQPEFVIYDGPPFANGTPHYGHLLTGFLKDVIPRYRTMRGERVERRFGWDCHGLPVETQAEKELGVSGRGAIASLGVSRFNERCRSIVGSTASAWRDYVVRQARWVDMDDDYRTLDLDYMESVMWAFKQLWSKGLLYEGQRVLPYCWECETPLSNFETRLDGSYRERRDTAVTVGFELETGERLLAWTTTPWTLPANLALGVGDSLKYAVLERGGDRWILSEESLPRYEHELAGATRVGTLAGDSLVGRRYRPLFPFFAETPDAFRVLSADFVAVGEGSGVVHLAPGFGEDDQRVCEQHGIPPLAPVDSRGRYTAVVGGYAGRHVFDANEDLVRELAARGALLRRETHAHSYPHCWRSDTPLIHRALPSWFLEVTAIKDRMVELNREIEWVPSHLGEGSFGRWLEGARDWSLSRNRFWGSPVPVWKSDDPAYPRVDVYGGLDELERDFGVRLDDLHRPAVDELVRPNPDDPTGESKMRRVEEVLDCWFESGSMPFAQAHYPFERRDWFESHFPGDFIVEYVGQTRGWFYTLHVLATALFDRPAFKSCIAHGVLLGDDGQKLSKRLRNYPDPTEVFDSLGADAMRWALMSSAAVRGGDMAVDRAQVEQAPREAMLPIWSTWKFLTVHANAAGERGRVRRDSENPLDRYALAKTSELCAAVAARLDAHDVSAAYAALAAHVETLNNWYIRRSRRRFRAGERTAIDTLHTVLHLLCRIAAPLLPLLTEAIFRDLGDGTSVHLTDWPAAEELRPDAELIATMDLVQGVCSAAASIRAERRLRRRVPLWSLEVAVPDPEPLLPFARLIREEVNVKCIGFVGVDALGAERVQLDLPAVAPRLGPATPAVQAALRRGDYDHDRQAGTLTVEGHVLEAGQFTHRLEPLDPETTATLAGGDGLVALDLEVTEELWAEGIARDLVRAINRRRREQGLDPSDRIVLQLDTGRHEDVGRAIDAHQALLREETGALEVSRGAVAEPCSLPLPDGRSVAARLTLAEASLRPSRGSRDEAPAAPPRSARQRSPAGT